MPAMIQESTFCVGFSPGLLEVGNDLIFYAFKIGSKGEYVTDICSRTNLAGTSKDFADLGWGRRPSSK